MNAAIKTAQAVMIFPSVLKGSFIIGAEGGNGVLLTKDANGEWSYPAFYTLGAGSIGLQAGFQDAEAVFVINTLNEDNTQINNEYIRMDKAGKITGVTHVTYIRRKK